MFLKKKGYWILGIELTWHSVQENLFWVSIVVTDLYFIHYNIFLQNVICIITKSDNHFVVKCDKNMLQNVSGFLLQNMTFFYKMQQVLQNVTVLLQM